MILRLLQTCALPSRVATASSVASPELLLGDEDVVGAGVALLAAVGVFAVGAASPSGAGIEGLST